METEFDSPEPEDNQSRTQSTTVVGVKVVNASSNTDDPDIAALKRLFQIALETRNFEISQLVQRNNFFMVFQGVLLAGLIQSSHTKPVVSFLVSVAGLAVSIYQVQMAAGAKFWQEYWEAAVSRIENELLSGLDQVRSGRTQLIHLFHEDNCIYEEMVKARMSEKGLGFTASLVMRRFSVSRVPIKVAVCLATVWGGLVLCTLRAYPPLSIPSFIVGF